MQEVGALRWLVRLEWLIGVAFAIGLVWSLNVVDYLPTNDGPQHSFAGYVKNHIDDPGTTWARDYTVNHPLTSNGYMDVFVVLEPVLGLERAHQATITLIILGWALAWFWWIRGETGPGRFVALVAFPAALQWMVWIGLYPFMLSSVGIPCVLMVRRRWGLTATVMVGLALAFVLMARVHIFGAAMAGLALVLWCALDDRPLASLLKTALVGIPSLGWVVAVGRASTTLQSGGTVWDVPLNPLELFLEFFLPGPIWQQVVFLLLVVVAMGSAVRFGGPRQRAMLGMGLLLVAVGVLMPLDWSSWQLVRPRLIPTGFCLILGAAVLSSRAAPLVGLAIVAFAIPRFVWAADLNRAAAAEVAPMVSAVEGLRLDGRQWVYLSTIGDDLPALRRLALASASLHLSQIVAPQLGGTPRFSHDADPSVHHILTRRQARPSPWLGSVELPATLQLEWFPERRPRERELHIVSYASALTTVVDTILLYGLEADADAVAQAGYVVERVRTLGDRGLFLAKWGGGCTLDLTFDGLEEPTVVIVGFGAYYEVRHAEIVSPGEALHLDGVPCGPAWFDIERECAEHIDGMVPVMPARVGHMSRRCTIKNSAP